MPYAIMLASDCRQRNQQHVVGTIAGRAVCAPHFQARGRSTHRPLARSISSAISSITTACCLAVRLTENTEYCSGIKALSSIMGFRKYFLIGLGNDPKIPGIRREFIDEHIFYRQKVHQHRVIDRDTEDYAPTSNDCSGIVPLDRIFSWRLVNSRSSMKMSVKPE